MLTGRRFRVEFTSEQEQFAENLARACRAVWNTGLEQRREYRRRDAWMNYRQQAGGLAEAKAEHPWLSEVPGHCLQQALMDLDRACRAHGTFKVRWRSSIRNRQETARDYCSNPHRSMTRLESSGFSRGEDVKRATIRPSPTPQRW